MRSLSRRQLLVSLLLAVLAVSATVMILRARSLRSRLTRVTVGMTGTQAEEILGAPVLVLPRSSGRGVAMVWGDQLWQVDVLTGPDDRIEKIGCVPSDSATRRIFGWLFQ